MSSHDLAYTEPEKIKSIDAEFLAGHRFPYQEDIVASRRRRPHGGDSR